MIVDLHSHYPMHLLAGESDTVALMTHPARQTLGDTFRAAVLRLANQVDNYQGKGGGPAVTIPSLAASNVRVALSVLYAPFDEVDLDLAYGAPPRSGYIEDVLKQIQSVEAEVRLQSDKAAVTHNHQELDAALAAGTVALIHAVEGGFHLGDSESTVRDNVARLAEQGVAYITVAHLFYRQVATNAPALPFLPDAVYATLFPQPRRGLTNLGVALITAMTEHHILVDVTHMSAPCIDETLQLLDRLDPNGEVPVIATHSACKTFSGAKYNLSDEHIAAIARRNGVVGLIACEHWMARGLPKPKTFEDTMATIYRHIDHIHDVVKAPAGAHKFVAFGSDQDGFIKPALRGLETPEGFTLVEAGITARYQEAARDICSGNALRVLNYWKGR